MGNVDSADSETAVEEKTYAGMTRRNLCLGAAAAVVMVGIGGIKCVNADSLIRPPGGQDQTHLIGGCIRCEKCYEICPRDVIKPATIETGVLNMRTPTFDFSENYCDFCAEENGGVPLCARSCPTEALQMPADINKVIIGKAVLNEDLCLAYKALGCRYCYDACPFGAMDLDDQGRPYVLTDKCNGCGACHSVCVSTKAASLSRTGNDAIVRAISVEPTDKVDA